MNTKPIQRGWCKTCGQAMWAPESGEYVCARCGDNLIAREDLPRRDRHVFDLQAWNDAVFLRGLGGPSPGGAAAILGCHRTMIDKLVDMKLLERSEYRKDGYFVVYISERSLKQAIENKKKTGKWTDSGED